MLRLLRFVPIPLAAIIIVLMVSLTNNPANETKSALAYGSCSGDGVLVNLGFGPRCESAQMLQFSFNNSNIAQICNFLNNDGSPYTGCLELTMNSSCNCFMPSFQPVHFVYATPYLAYCQQVMYRPPIQFIRYYPQAQQVYWHGQVVQNPYLAPPHPAYQVYHGLWRR